MIVTAENQNKNGEQVLDEIRDFTARFCKMPNQAALDVATLWMAHCHVTDKEERLAFPVTPRLAILSDEPDSGKTTLLEMIARLTPNARMIIDPTPASFAIGVHEKRATSLIDEIDILFGQGNAKAQLRSLLNAGYKRKGAVWERANKEDYIIFGPLALCGMGAKFRGTSPLKALKSRSIPLEMKAAVEGELESYRDREHDAMASKLKFQLHTWVTRHAGEILEDWPTLPEGIFNRLAEIWEPLFMVANVAGGHWPESVMRACKQIALGNNKDAPDELTITEKLLIDLRTVFHEQDRPGMSRESIVKALRAIPGSAWSQLWPHDVSAPSELGALLTPEGIATVQIWEDGRNKRGYKAQQFIGLWSDLPPMPEPEEDLDDKEPRPIRQVEIGTDGP